MTSTLWRWMKSPLDQRPLAEIRAEIEEEMASHIAMIVEELVEGGMARGDAEREAHRRFGPAAKYQTQCTRIALQERMMLQRINIVLLVVVVVALGLTTWQSWAGQRKTAEAVEQLTTKLEAAGVISPVRSEALRSANTHATEGVAYVSGKAVRSGAYALPKEGMSLRQLLAAGGWDGTEVSVRIRHGQGPQTKSYDYSLGPLSPSADTEPTIQPGDVLEVHSYGQEQAAPAATRPAKPDDTGLLRSLTFSPRVLERINELLPDCFKKYDEATAALGLDALTAQSETVLVVGEVERPGVYRLDAIKASRGVLRGSDVLMAAGAKSDVTCVDVVGRTESKRLVFGAALTFAKSPGGSKMARNEWTMMDLAPGSIVWVRSDDQSSARWPATVYWDKGQWRRLDCLFDEAAFEALERTKGLEWGWPWPGERGPVPANLARDPSKVADVIEVCRLNGPIPSFRLLTRFKGEQAPEVTLRDIVSMHDGPVQRLTRLPSGESQVRPLKAETDVIVEVQAADDVPPRVFRLEEAAESAEIVPPSTRVTFKTDLRRGVVQPVTGGGAGR